MIFPLLSGWFSNPKFFSRGILDIKLILIPATFQSFDTWQQMAENCARFFKAFLFLPVFLFLTVNLCWVDIDLRRFFGLRKVFKTAHPVSICRTDSTKINRPGHNIRMY